MASSILQWSCCGSAASGGILRSKVRKCRVSMQCASSNSQGSGMDEELDRVLGHDEALFSDLSAAVRRVEAARREIEGINELELKAQQALVEECEEEFAAAQAELKAAEISLQTARAAERKWESDNVNEPLERLQSGKAALVSALVGTCAALPLTLIHCNQGFQCLLINEATVFASCAAFGVTYRYIIRKDTGNLQLKSGSAAGFALVRGLGSQFDMNSDLAEVLGALGQSFVIFLAATLAMDFCIKTGVLQTFPSEARRL